MAGLPQRASRSSAQEPTKVHYAIVDALERGEGPNEIAKRLAKGDKKKAARLRQKIWRMARHDALMQRAIVERAQAQSLVAMPRAMDAATKRAGRGRMDAVKFMAEASGIHNPRVQHEHSGEVKIKLDMPRPKLVDTQSIADDQIEDADVVEDPDEA